MKKLNEFSTEILTLSKMNWNSSDGISRLPITLLFARRIGGMLSLGDISHAVSQRMTAEVIKAVSAHHI